MILDKTHTIRKTTKKVSKDRIYRSVASSSAIESNQSTQEIEQQLKSKTSPYCHLMLAD